MLRRRSIAASPARGTGEAWEVIAALFADTLDRSPRVSRVAVEDAMGRAAGVGRLLIAGGHLEKTALTLVAGDLHLEVTTVSGDSALSLDENLNPVPGGASAESWTIYLPQCGPLEAAIRDAAKAHEHLSADDPPAPAAQPAASAALDESALRRWAAEGQ